MPTAPLALMSRTHFVPSSGVVSGFSGSQERIGKDARRGDLVTLATTRLAGAPLDAVAATGVADGRDAVAHPEFVYILRRHALFPAADVTVHVDEAGQHIVIAQIDFAAARFQLRPVRRFLGAAGRAHRKHVHDAIAFDDDIGRAERRARRCR